jgi:serine/threonine protein kinase
MLGFVGELQPMEPRLLGRYAIYDKIASGGMATVHLGRMLGAVGFARTVAIKRLHPQYAEDPEFVSMFLDEARLVARISHPNVVPTLDVVNTDGELIIVMEYIRGESLARLIRAAAQRDSVIPAPMAATLLVGVLHGLHAAHEAKSERGEPLGIVHRDVSPHNILIGIDGVPRVLDFGVAKAMGRVQTTREGQLKGKLAYMAPEQIAGVTTRATDIYAASIVLWESLTGRRLFAGDNEGQVFDRVLKGSTVPPSAYVPDLPRGLDEVTLRGLSVDPAGRYATARDMARALEDAVTLVSPSKIGEWVEAAARQTLDHRNERIAAIESSTWTQVPASLARVRTETRIATHAAPDSEWEEAISIASEDFTQLSSGSVSGAARALAAKRRRPIASSVLGGVAVGAVVVGLLRFLAPAGPGALATSPPRSATSPNPGSPSAGAPPPIAAPPAAASATAPSEAPPQPLASPTPSAASQPPASASSPSPSTPAQRPVTVSATPVSRPTPQRSAAPADENCSPPFFFDAKGVRVFKKECL